MFNTFHMERVLAMALFDTLYFIYFKEVFQYVKNRVQNQEIAKDITQDVFVKACENKEFLRELNKTKIKEKLINAAQDLCEEFLQKQQVIPLTVLIVGLLVTIAGSLISPGIVDVAEAVAVSPLFWIRIFGSLLIPATLIIYMLVGKKSAIAKYVLAAATFAFIGELSGRALFYHTVMSQYPWF